MILALEQNAAILLPWKTASQTLVARLHPYDRSPYPKGVDFNPFLSRAVHQHLTRADFEALPEARMGLRVAAFVRNPYDRVYSGFGQLQRDIQVARDPDFPWPSAPWLRELVMIQLAENEAQLQRAGFAFDAWMALVKDHQVLEAGVSTFPLHPAHYWTHYSDQIADFVGRVECFEIDFTRLCEWLGIERAGDTVANVTGGGGYVRLMARRSIDRINELFARDFDLFGYAKL